MRAALPGGDVRDDAAARALYAYDASNYRSVPAAVVVPRTADELAAALAVCREHGAPFTVRGAGTSIAGNATAAGPGGVVADTSVHLHRILALDPEARTATVEPGVILDDLQRAARAHGLRFGPDPSTHARCTLGGMIGNNSCGSHSPAWGTTADNVLALDVLTADGRRLTVRHDSLETAPPAPELTAALVELTTRHMAALRTTLGRFPRQISGYGLHRLLPEHGRNLAAALTGTEGGCAVVLAATVRLVPLPEATTTVVLGFDDLPAAGDAVPAILPHRPLACEGLGAEMIETLRRRSPGSDPGELLPPGRAWLMVEFDASPDAPAPPDPKELQDGTGAASSRAVADPAEQRRLTRLREESSGLATRAPDGAEAWPGWEDAAVPPERLGAYLRGFLRLLDAHRLRGTPYGHFGEGCVHVRIDFDLATAAGRRRFRAFLEDAARLVAEHGGTLSGEHGDGRARSELMPLVYPAELLDAFAAFKRAWDPSGLLNPGAVVEPHRLDAALRIVPDELRARPVPVFLGLPEDGGDLARAVRRCVGVAKCRTAPEAGGVMCPSWRATGEEMHSTRGRARLLDDMLRGLAAVPPDAAEAPVTGGGWRSEEVREALDLCLSCKGCRSDCPVGVDMASYKAEFLHHHYAGRRRPASHYSLGRLPQWLHTATASPSAVRAANAAMRNPVASRALKRTAGIAPERPLPPLAAEPFRRWFARRAAPTPSAASRPVMLWADTFTNAFVPEVGRAAVAVLEHAGFTVTLPPEPARGPLCCGLTWISTGQLDAARRHLARSREALAPALDGGVPVVALEPSCAAVFRSDAAELGVPGLDGVLTLAELLERHAPDADLGSVPPARGAALSQTHCHQHAVLGSAADDAVLARVGVANERLDRGCCGLAGNFGYEAGHYDMSVAVGENGPLPAIRDAAPGTAVLADGFSCRTQVTQLTERRPLHLAELLAAALPAARGDDHR
ncbi:FAD-binding oxidoreductase [Mangrovactinospora gilvigrisea]|uniref:FAD-binding oxidoreductase n=1 Tax=Mangrovactinospora gilvigrisea TaxID=1428644 RepID=A0A1J7BID4_9ACTN|nr:FAD-binding oxidoreductase [Mangrovactinospora gilvigrisea]